MVRPRTSRVRFDSKRTLALAYRPHLEEIEARVLPGETVGLGLLASYTLFANEPSLLANQEGEFSISVGATPSPESTDGTQWAVIPRNIDLNNTRLPALSASRNTPVPLVTMATVASTVQNAPAADFANDVLDPSALFAPARPVAPPAPASADAAGHAQGLAGGFAIVPLLGSSASSSLGVPVEGSTAHAAIANPGPPSAGLSNSGPIPQHGLTAIHDLNGPSWSSYAHDPQHTAISDVPSQSLQAIHWQTPVDLNPQSYGGDLYIHYGSPVVTAANTVIVPVKTGTNDGFEVEAFDGGSGSLKWTVATDYSVPFSYWTPPMSLVLTSSNRLYIPGAGGTVYYLDHPDAPNATITGQLAFYGIANYDPSLASNVKISTPLTVDSAGNLYFGFQVYGPTALSLQNGIARMDPSGNGSWVAASTAAGDPAVAQVVLNCAPALSNDQTSLYIAVSSGGFSTGYLVRLDSTTLNPLGQVLLRDPSTGTGAALPDVGTASPTVGPDGDVYFGVLDLVDGAFTNNDRGWLLHFSSDLTQTKIPGAFGWDDTASIVPASMVPAYSGSSTYLVMTKYNNYKEDGGDGVNKIAVLDPNAPMTDPITQATVMQEVLKIAGLTPDPVLPYVREWCINTAAVDPATDSILANSEDGTLYRWNLATNSFTEVMPLTSPTGEAYTPTVIGVDGTVFAINDSTLFAVGLAQN